jgi:predicted O-methyltransferase YrrM
MLAIATSVAVVGFATNASCPPLAPIKAMARTLSQQLIDDRNATKYTVHGLFGIFGRGDLIPGSSRSYFKDYEDVKVNFMHKHACLLGHRYKQPTVCEVGFNAGLSALLLLESIPHARVLSFDLGDFPWARPADAILRRQYGPARFPGVVFGDARETITKVATEERFKCDMVFVDGDKSYQGRYDALVALLNVSNTHSAVFMDEVTTQACVDGTYASGADHARQCAALDAGYWPSVRAYNRACREGWLSVQSCAWPGRHRHDGICLGRFGRRRRAHKRAPTKRKQ